MAHYKMCVQLRDQSRAFFHGFREFIQHDWLGIFSGPELQKLISGDSTSLDVSDLRYVQFFQFLFFEMTIFVPYTLGFIQFPPTGNVDRAGWDTPHTGPSTVAALHDLTYSHIIKIYKMVNWYFESCTRMQC